MPAAIKEGEQSSCLHHAKISIEKKGYFRSKSYLFSMFKKSILKAQSTSLLQFGSFQVYSKESESMYSVTSKNTENTEIRENGERENGEKSNISNSKSTTFKTNKKNTKPKWSKVGLLNSPGILWDRSVVADSKKHTKAAIMYDNTSRTGDLMNMTVIIPTVRKEPTNNVSEIIYASTVLNRDCSQVVTEFLGDLFWTEDIEKIPSSGFNNLMKDPNNNKVMIMKNKLPTWNSYINAYTLEFGGRALIPSVHNFQLIDKNNNIILQLGKVSEFEFNVDFTFPLSPFQAFTICLSVVDRTFVWD